MSMFGKSKRIVPGPGQESVWDYPRPPALEKAHERLRVMCGGTVIGETTAGYRVLETSHPPVYYFPSADVHRNYLVPEPDRSYCEFKGTARYWGIEVAGIHCPRAAWSYPVPAPAFAAIKDHLAFYASDRVEAWVGDEQVQAQEGDFYGGWITSRIVGPFKGGAGTRGW